MLQTFVLHKLEECTYSGPSAHGRYSGQIGRRTFPELDCLYGSVLWLVACENIDMIVVEGRCGNHKSMGVESGRCDGG